MRYDKDKCLILSENSVHFALRAGCVLFRVRALLQSFPPTINFLEWRVLLRDGNAKSRDTQPSCDKTIKWLPDGESVFKWEYPPPQFDFSRPPCINACKVPPWLVFTRITRFTLSWVGYRRLSQLLSVQNRQQQRLSAGESPLVVQLQCGCPKVA